ncbi:UNVERIFIED_CONTAM: hypothetical protein Sangu_0386200 [Sesamum angustifolium]|uniref:RING-type domain-containing protein n=1 Tax=Sesamum angustifolium TaxID=2727405 RepID=A0AAW2QS82_9LAMI
MGFDIECIIDIHTYPGEYFCPVCRTLVYPSEAFQSQCTHLYCKPCLAHIANGSRACPYDGYLVTESDSKPLMDSNKVLAENIGKVKVHCLYFRSGCSWEGTLSDCSSHCAGCSFGNSPVICNRCGIQIVHRQVHDHAQSCPGVFDGQNAIGGVSASTGSGTTSSTVAAEVNRSAAQSGAPPPQTQNPQNVAATAHPGQNPILQVNSSSQLPVVAPVTVPTPEQWYQQQQYLQYYQQYVGYDPYQQANQQYYPLQQQSFQQYQQQPMQVQVPQQPHVYAQALPQPHQQSQPQLQQHPQLQAQVQPQPQPQTNPVPQPPSHLQLQVQGQAQQQPHPQPQLLPQSQPQAQVLPQTQAHVHAPGQALAPNYQVNPQQQTHPSMRPQTQTQIPPQAPPPPPSSQSAQPPTFTQAVGMRPPTQHPQVPQFPQPHAQIHLPQASQSHGHSQMHPQPQPQPQPQNQSSNQSHVKIQPQAQPYHSQSQPPVYPPQANQSTAPPALPQAPHPPIPPVSGHHSYQQPQPPHKMHSGASHQHPVQPQGGSGSLHPVHVHGQVPQQPGVIRPPHSHGSIPQQQASTLLPPQNQVSGVPAAQHQQFPPHMQPPSYPHPHRPVLQPVQQSVPQQYAQQQNFVVPFQGQLHQQGHFPQQQPMQPQLRSTGPPPPQQPQNYVGRPMMTNQGMHPQNHPLSTGVFPPHPGPAQLTSTQAALNQNYAMSTVMEQNATGQETGSPSKGLVEKGFEGEPPKEEIVKGQSRILTKDADTSEGGDLINSVIKQEDDVRGSLDRASGGKSFEAGAAEHEFSKQEGHPLTNSDSLKQAEPENKKMIMSNTVVSGPSLANFEKQSHSASATGTEGHVLPQQSHGSHQQGPQERVQGPPPSLLGAQGPVVLPHPGQCLNSNEGRVTGYVGPPPKNFDSQSTTQGPGPSTLSDSRGLMGRATPARFEVQFGTQHVDRTNEVAMSKDQMPGSSHLSGSVGEDPLNITRGDEPSILRMNGGTAPDSSMLVSRDEKLKSFSREHLDLFPGERTRPLDQAPTYLDKGPHGQGYDGGSKLDPGASASYSRFLPSHHPSGPGRPDMHGPGHEFDQHHMKHFARRSPNREYVGSSPHGFGGPSSYARVTAAFDDINSRSVHRYGEGSRSYSLSSDPVGNPFRDGRFPSMSRHPQRDEIGGPRYPRFGGHMSPGQIQNPIGSDDVFGPDGPGHLVGGKFLDPAYLPGHFDMADSGSGAFPGHGRPGELGGPGNFPLPFTEPVRGDRQSFPHFGEPAMRNSYSLPGFPGAGNFAGGMDSFNSRKRKPVSTGWCRICEVDCETVEGLDMHSQTREHQKMAMDMVKTIKLQNNKKQRNAAGHMVHEGGSRSRKAGIVGRGGKP